jgi:hypothetical protein
MNLTEKQFLAVCAAMAAVKEERGKIEVEFGKCRFIQREDGSITILSHWWKDRERHKDVTAFYKAYQDYVPHKPRRL